MVVRLTLLAATLTLVVIGIAAIYSVGCPALSAGLSSVAIAKEEALAKAEQAGPPAKLAIRAILSAGLSSVAIAKEEALAKADSGKNRSSSLRSGWLASLQLTSSITAD